VFSQDEGQVQWVATYVPVYDANGNCTRNCKPDTVGKKFEGVPYVQGHTYYTTITYTSGVWWTCAGDRADIRIYQCVQHEGAAAGEHLVEDPLLTSVFAEVWNLTPVYTDEPGGSPVQWIVKNATIIVPNESPHPWPSQARYTVDACKIDYSPALAIGGSLANSGTAYFVTSNIPPFCADIASNIPAPQ
jgi:hypothetical protein